MFDNIIGKRAAQAKIAFFAWRDEKNRQVCLIRRSRKCCEGIPAE